MATIDISARIIGDKELSAALARLSSHDIPKAVAHGVRTASRGAKTALGKHIGAVTPISSARIKQDVHVAIAGDGQSAKVYISSQPISALRFKPRQTRSGLQLSLYKGERTVIRSGFMQTSRAQRWRGQLPFRPAQGRAYSYDARRKNKRKGMEFVFGLSIASIYLGGRHSARLQELIEARVEEQLVKGILQRLGAMGRGYGR